MNAPQQPKLRLRDRRRRVMWLKVAAGAGVVAVALVLMWYAVRLPEVIVANVAVEGAHLAKIDMLTQMAEAALSGSYAFLIPKNNTLFVPKQNIASAIEAAFPEVVNVSVTRDGWQKIIVSVTEHTAAALWCESDANNALCYLMNKDGFIFAEASSTDSYVRFFGALPDVPIGTTYLQEGFAALDIFVGGIAKATNRTPISVLVDENDDVTVTFAEGGTLKFVRTANQKDTINNINSVFASRKFNTDEKLEYADFRFGNKVYVKFRENE